MKKLNKNKIISSVLLLPLLLNPITTLAYTKNETVYSNLNYNGTVKETTVNSHLSKLNKEMVEDESVLTKITNLNGEEKYKQENNRLIWDSTGKDIFYQGKAKEDLPISISINYYLNGNKTTPKKMLNKKGNVTIKITLENKSFIEEKNLHTPFVVSAGLMFDSTKDTDIEITNGEVEETGTRSMAIALAAPGLYDDLKTEELKSFDEITINYKTSKFTLNNIYFVATPKVFEKVDMNNLNKVNKLTSSIKTLQENMDKIDNGAKELNEGSEKLDNGSNILLRSLNIALEGIKKLETGFISIDSGVEQISNALTLAKNELNTSSLIYLQSANNNAANTLFSSLQQQGLSNNLITLFNQFTLSSFNLGGTYTDSVTANTALQNYLLNSSYQNQTADLMKLKNLYDVYLLLNMDASAFNKTKEKINYLSSQIDTLLVGINNLKNATSQLTTGIKDLKSGINSLYLGANSLNQGTKELRDGTNTLSNGIRALNKEGINKLTETTKKVTNYSNKAQELVKLSKDYKGFSSTNSNKTIFIYKVRSAS